MMVKILGGKTSWKWQQGPLSWEHKRGGIRCLQNKWAFPAQYVATVKIKTKSNRVKDQKEHTEQGQQWSVILTYDIYPLPHDDAHRTYLKRFWVYKTDISFVAT